MQHNAHGIIGNYFPCSQPGGGRLDKYGLGLADEWRPQELAFVNQPESEENYHPARKIE